MVASSLFFTPILSCIQACHGYQKLLFPKSSAQQSALIPLTLWSAELPCARQNPSLPFMTQVRGDWSLVGSSPWLAVDALHGGLVPGGLLALIGC